MDRSLSPQLIERAKAFWADVDVDHVFDYVSLCVEHLRTVLKRNVARDEDYVQGVKLLSCLDYTGLSPGVQTVFHTLLSSDQAQPADAFLQNPRIPPAGSHENMAPFPSTQTLHQPHTCSPACLSTFPSMPRGMPPFWAQNPLKIPLLCGFRRFRAVSEEEAACWGEDPMGGPQIVYKAPCGLSLRRYDDVMRFLSVTDSYDFLQVDFFSFNPAVRLTSPTSEGPAGQEVDLSRGMEPTPVELCPPETGCPPPEFRYRKDRWPHGCFLNRGPQLFSVCCDCTDGCTVAKQCACVRMTTGGRHYAHHRLTEPVQSGVFECGPWCGCDRRLCQNRLVQRGITVRLQVFQTENRGWGVRCRDDLDQGTFVCIYAGVLLSRVARQTEAPPPKLMRADLPSDDDVEVVTEWVASPCQEVGGSRVDSPPNLSPPVLSPLYVPVIQRPSESSSPNLGDEQGQAGSVDVDPSSAAGQAAELDKMVALVTVNSGTTDADDDPEPGTSGKRSVSERAEEGEAYLLDASKEGNVGRFINHDCRPNLFIQNVFTDCHDPRFPLIAFFTSRVVRAGSELTWDYSSSTGSCLRQRQEVPCLCGSDGCQGYFDIENLCEE